MTSDVFFFLGVFIFIFVVWVATGGPERPISFTGPYLYPIQTTGVNATAYGDGRAIDTSTKAGSIGSNLKDTRVNIEELKKQLADLKAFGESSPYRGLVTIDHSTYGPAQSDVKKEYITIRYSSSADNDLTITGWRVVSGSSGASAIIGAGAKLVRAGSLNPTSEIALAPGDSAIIQTGSSPIGDSFQENRCSGYLDQFQNFEPTFSNNCPSPTDEFRSFYTGSVNAAKDDRCYDFLKTLPSCVLPTNVSRDLPSQCRDFISDRLNYNGCVAAHEFEPKFFTSTWRIFLDHRNQMWREGAETIKLLDREGKTVDLFAY
jgi:hypothetical protein